MENRYTAVTLRGGEWWVGWIEEVAGVNAQERTREELLISLREALREALTFKPMKARRNADTPGS